MREASRDFQLFLNGLKILRGLDRHTLVKAGVLAEADHFGWILARDHSETFFREVCYRDKELAAALWRLIESRQSPDLREVA